MRCAEEAISRFLSGENAKDGSIVSWKAEISMPSEIRENLKRKITSSAKASSAKETAKEKNKEKNDRKKDK